MAVEGFWLMDDPEAASGSAELIRIEGADRDGGFLILCDHASNRLPQGLGTLGLPAVEMERHIAWDPGALAVARRLADKLASPLLYPEASRLLIDCNRPIAAPDSIALRSEETEIPGNQALAPELRRRRIQAIYEPYHAAIDRLVRARAGRPLALVAIHSFTPRYRGRERPWQVSLIVAEDRRLAEPLLAALRRDRGLRVGVNEPYSPADGVYHTLERHASAAGLPAAMIEIRNDQIASAAAQEAWAARLAAPLREAAAGLDASLAEPDRA